MKSISKLMAFVLALIMVACSFTAYGGEEAKVSDVADEFMSAYTDLDFEKAVKYCSGDAATSIKATNIHLNSFDKTRYEAAVERFNTADYKILSVDVNIDEGTAKVELWTAIEGEEANGGLDLEKIDGKWKIVHMY